jgi:hypothetical protein
VGKRHSPREILREPEQETALQHCEDVRQPLSIAAESGIEIGRRLSHAELTAWIVKVTKHPSIPACRKAIWFPIRLLIETLSPCSGGTKEGHERGKDAPT